MVSKPSNPPNTIRTFLEKEIYCGNYDIIFNEKKINYDVGWRSLVEKSNLGGITQSIFSPPTYTLTSYPCSKGHFLKTSRMDFAILTLYPQ